MFEMHTSEAAQLQSKSYAGPSAGRRSLQLAHRKTPVDRVFWQTPDRCEGGAFVSTVIWKFEKRNPSRENPPGVSDAVFT